MKQETIGWQWHQSDHMQLRKSLAPCAGQTDNHASTSSLIYEPDALPDTQPTVSEH